MIGWSGRNGRLHKRNEHREQNARLKGKLARPAGGLSPRLTLRRAFADPDYPRGPPRKLGGPRGNGSNPPPGGPHIPETRPAMR